jgi:hypothetical protein
MEINKLFGILHAHLNVKTRGTYRHHSAFKRDVDDDNDDDDEDDDDDDDTSDRNKNFFSVPVKHTARAQRLL